MRLPREWSRCRGVRVACSDSTPPSECRECTSIGEAGFPECGGSRRDLAESRFRSPGKDTGQRGRALVALSQVAGLQLVPLSVVVLSQECLVQRLVVQGLTQLWGQEAGETEWSVGTTSGEQAGEECP